MRIDGISKDTLVNKGGTVQFMVNGSGVGILNYQWMKRGADRLPDKVSGGNTTLLKIPNVDKSDEGQYYCIVTNMWNRSVESVNVALSVYGMLRHIICKLDVTP